MTFRGVTWIFNGEAPNIGGLKTWIQHHRKVQPVCDCLSKRQVKWKRSRLNRKRWLPQYV